MGPRKPEASSPGSSPRAIAGNRPPPPPSPAPNRTSAASACSGWRGASVPCWRWLTPSAAPATARRPSAHPAPAPLLVARLWRAGGLWALRQAPAHRSPANGHAARLRGLVAADQGQRPAPCPLRVVPRCAHSHARPQDAARPRWQRSPVEPVVAVCHVQRAEAGRAGWGVWESGAPRTGVMSQVSVDVSTIHAPASVNKTRCHLQRTGRSLMCPLWVTLFFQGGGLGAPRGSFLRNVAKFV